MLELRSDVLSGNQLIRVALPGLQSIRREKVLMRRDASLADLSFCLAEPTASSSKRTSRIVRMIFRRLSP